MEVFFCSTLYSINQYFVWYCSTIWLLYRKWVLTEVGSVRYSWTLFVVNCAVINDRKPVYCYRNVHQSWFDIMLLLPDFQLWAAVIALFSSYSSESECSKACKKPLRTIFSLFIQTTSDCFAVLSLETMLQLNVKCTCVASVASFLS